MDNRQAKRPGAVVVAVLLWLAPFLNTDSRAEAQFYDIELVVFQNLVQNDAGEVWPAGQPAWSDGEEPQVDTGPELTWLNKPYRLGAHYEALRRSAQYRPLAHFAWRQPVRDRGRATALQLPASGAQAGGAYVDGSVRVAVERYLHLELDLQLHEARTVLLQADPGLEAQAAPELRLKEKRRMRSKELHYFDNPRFGALALITPYARAAADGDNAGTGDTAP